MPGPKTHDIFYKQIKDKLNTSTFDSLTNFDNYNIFAQGHDLLLYADFYKPFKLKKNIEESLLLQSYNFPMFVYCFLKEAQSAGIIEIEQIRLFIHGYVLHHILDSYIHPFLIYTTGSHTPDKKQKTWEHGNLETLIDSYMMKKYEGKSSRTYKSHLDFQVDFILDKTIIEILDKILAEVYNINNGGSRFKKGIYQLESFIRLMKYDPSGCKRELFNCVEVLTERGEGARSLSYNVDYFMAVYHLNLSNEVWYNPDDLSVSSNDSFFDLYDKALSHGVSITERLEALCKSSFNQDDIFNIVPDISSITGLKSVAQL